MAEENISLESIVQHKLPVSGDEPAAQQSKPVILITHATTESAIRSALENIQNDGHLAAKPQMIRIET